MRRSGAVRSRELYAVVTPTALAGNVDDYNPTGLATARVLRISPGAARTISGIVAQPGRLRRLVLVNLATDAGHTISLLHEQTSVAANQFTLPGLDTLVIAAGGSLEIWYDRTSARWKCF